MKKTILVSALFCVLLSGCSSGCWDWMNPSVSAAQTNREMLELSKQQTQLMERNNRLLDSLIVEVHALRGRP